jgi:hypothetical protein
MHAFGLYSGQRCRRAPELLPCPGSSPFDPARAVVLATLVEGAGAKALTGCGTEACSAARAPQPRADSSGAAQAPCVYQGVRHKLDPACVCVCVLQSRA